MSCAQTKLVTSSSLTAFPCGNQSVSERLHQLLLCNGVLMGPLLQTRSEKNALVATCTPDSDHIRFPTVLQPFLEGLGQIRGQVLNGPPTNFVIWQPVILAFLGHQLDEHLDRVLLTAVVEEQRLCPMTVATLSKRQSGSVKVLLHWANFRDKFRRH